MNKKRYKGSGFLNYRYSAQICYVSFDISWNFAMEANRMVDILELYVFRPFWPILANQKPLLWHVWESRWAFLPFWRTHFATLNSQWRPLGTPLGTLRWPVWPSWAHVGKLPKNCQQTQFVRMTCWSLLWKVAHAIRSRLCSPNTHFTLNSDTFFERQK